HRFVERTARDLAQVEHQAVDPPAVLALQRRQRIVDVDADVTAELVDAYDADAAVLQLVGDRLQLDQPARDRHVERLVAAGAEDREADRAARGPTHLLDRLVELKAVDQLTFDVGDVVAGLDA